jgi:hypothetical protein
MHRLVIRRADDMTKSEKAEWEMVRSSARAATVKAWAGLTISHCETFNGIPCDRVARNASGKVVSILTNRFELRSV